LETVARNFLFPAIFDSFIFRSLHYPRGKLWLGVILLSLAVDMMQTPLLPHDICALEIGGKIIIKFAEENVFIKKSTILDSVYLYVVLCKIKL